MKVIQFLPMHDTYRRRYYSREDKWMDYFHWIKSFKDMPPYDGGDRGSKVYTFLGRKEYER